METRIEPPSFINNGRVDFGTWKNKKNHKIFADWLGKILGYTKQEHWYGIELCDIKNNYGHSLVQRYYHGNAGSFVIGIFCDKKWHPWKFKRIPHKYWHNIDNHKLYAKWLFKELGYTTPEQWYKLTDTIFTKYDGHPLLTQYYKTSPRIFLNTLFPEYEWITWKFEQVPLPFWKNKCNIKDYMLWLGKILGYTKPEHWYNITSDDLKNNYGTTPLQIYGGPSQLVMSVIHNKEWHPWKFTRTKQLYFDNYENRKTYTTWLGNELGYSLPEDWYNISCKKIIDNHGQHMFQKFYSSCPMLFVMDMFPEITWDKGKFYKRYSEGQIEWLEYLRVSTPDIRHAVNNINGEYSIPNSRYSADGYSEIENEIFEYNGDWIHGNPKIFNSNEIQPRKKITFGELYENTQKKKQFCINNGYKYVSIWESEWLTGKNAVRKLQKKWRKK